MTKIAAALVLLGLSAFTCQALVVPEDSSSVVAPLPGVDFNVDSKEAVQVGQILRSVARDLYSEGQRDNETDEYFIKALWGKIVEAVRRAVRKTMNTVGEAVNEAAASINEATREAAQRAKEQALKILEKLLGDNAARYEGDEFDNKADFVRVLCVRIDGVGKSLVDAGRKSGNQ